MHDFQGTHQTNIPLSKGDIVKVLGEDRNGWIHVKAGDATGQVPTAYLEFSAPLPGKLPLKSPVPAEPDGVDSLQKSSSSRSRGVRENAETNKIIFLESYKSKSY